MDAIVQHLHPTYDSRVEVASGLVQGNAASPSLRYLVLVCVIKRCTVKEIHGYFGYMKMGLHMYICITGAVKKLMHAPASCPRLRLLLAGCWLLLLLLTRGVGCQLRVRNRKTNKIGSDNFLKKAAFICGEGLIWGGVQEKVGDHPISFSARIRIGVVCTHAVLTGHHPFFLSCCPFPLFYLPLLPPSFRAAALATARDLHRAYAASP